MNVYKFLITIFVRVPVKLCFLYLLFNTYIHALNILKNCHYFFTILIMGKIMFFVLYVFFFSSSRAKCELPGGPGALPASPDEDSQRAHREGRAVLASIVNNVGQIQK